MKKAKDQPESEPAELASLVVERIRKIRKEEGLSLELFALRCDMNAAYVGHIERGVQNPTLNTLERICKGLDIRVEDLFIDKSATVDMNTAALQYFSQITRDLSPEQFHRLLNIIGHADTEMTEHYLHVKESIRQSAIQLFSEAFSA